MDDSGQNTPTSHIRSLTESSPATNKSRFANIVKDAMHYLKVPFPEKDKFGRPRADSASSLGSWATFRRQNASDTTVYHSSAELSIFCAGENITPASSKSYLGDNLSSMNTLDSVHAALDALSFPAPQLSSTSTQVNDRAMALPQGQAGTTRLDYSQRRPVHAPLLSQFKLSGYLSQSSVTTGPRDEIRAAGESPPVRSEFTTMHLPTSTSLSSQSSKSVYSQDPDEFSPTVCTSLLKQSAEGTSSSIYASLSPLNSLGLFLNGEQSAGVQSTSPKKSPIIGAPFGTNDEDESLPKLGDDGPILSSQFNTVNAPRAPLNPCVGYTRARSDTTVTLNSNSRHQPLPRSESLDSIQPPMLRSPHASRPTHPRLSAGPRLHHPQPKHKPLHGCLFLLNESELKPDQSDLCDCDDCSSRDACESDRETPGHKFTRIINERHAMRPKTIVEESGSSRSVSGSSSITGASGCSDHHADASSSGESLLLNPSSTHLEHVKVSSPSVKISNDNRERHPINVPSVSKALPPLPPTTALNTMNPRRRPSLEDPGRLAVVNQAVLSMLFGEPDTRTVDSSVPSTSSFEPLPFPRALSSPGFRASTNTANEPSSPTASRYSANQQRAPMSPLGSPLSNLFDLPLEPINYPPISPRCRAEQPLQRKSTIFGLLKKTRDAPAPGVPPDLTPVNTEKLEMHGVKTDVGAKVEKGFLSVKREKKVPPPILVAPYQEHRNELPTQTSMFEIYDDPFARIVSPPQSPSSGQAARPREHHGSKTNLNCPISPYSPTPSSWTAVSYASSPTLANHLPASPQSASSPSHVSPSFNGQSPDIPAVNERSSHRRSSSEIHPSKSLQRFLPKRFGFIRPFHNTKQARKGAALNSATDTEDEARSPRSPFLVKDLSLFDELTVDSEGEGISSAKKRRTPKKTKRRGLVVI